MLAQTGATDLELRLDEQDDVAAGSKKRREMRQHEPQGDEAEVAHDEVEGLPELAGSDVADAQPGSLGDPGICRDVGHELPVPDIESDDLAHPPFQEDLRESAGRGADVKAPPGDREAVGGEVSQRRVELARGPPDPDLAALDRQRRARRHPLRGATRGGLRDPHGSPLQEVAGVPS